MFLLRRACLLWLQGLSAGLLRQATYTTARMGIFSTLSDYMKEQTGGKPLPLYQKAGCGLAAGGLGALVGSPADLFLIRMQADGTLPAAERRNYKGVMDALVTIVKEDGIGGLFAGMTMNKEQGSCNDCEGSDAEAPSLWFQMCDVYC